MLYAAFTWHDHSVIIRILSGCSSVRSTKYKISDEVKSLRNKVQIGNPVQTFSTNLKNIVGFLFINFEMYFKVGQTDILHYQIEVWVRF